MSPAQVPEGSHVVAVCETCSDHRYLSRALMIEKVGDVPMIEVERRVRCIARPWSNKRGPACGGRMALEFGGLGYAESLGSAMLPKLQPDKNPPPQ